MASCCSTPQFAGPLNSKKSSDLILQPADGGADSVGVGGSGAEGRAQSRERMIYRTGMCFRMFGPGLKGGTRRCSQMRGCRRSQTTTCGGTSNFASIPKEFIKVRDRRLERAAGLPRSRRRRRRPKRKVTSRSKATRRPASLESSRLAGGRPTKR